MNAYTAYMAEQIAQEIKVENLIKSIRSYDGGIKYVL